MLQKEEDIEMSNVETRPLPPSDPISEGLKFWSPDSENIKVIKA